MLLQSHMGFIQFLPALPDAWASGSVSGLRARGNFEVDLTWENGQLKEAVLTSEAGEPCSLRYGKATLELKTKKGQKYSIVFENGQLLQRD